MSRQSLIVTLLLAAALAALLARPRTPPAAGPRALAWIATARQFGPVGYRDPAGAVSPDGKWIAYSEGRFLRVRPIDGGAGVEFPAGPGQIRHLAWKPDNRTIIADGDDTSTWAVFDRVRASRDPLTVASDETKPLRQITVSPDGTTIAGVVNGPDGPELRTVSLDSPSLGSRDPRDSRDSRASQGRPMPRSISFPVWTPKGEIACIAMVDGRSRVTLPCGGAPLPGQPPRDAYGPVAFAADGSAAFVSYANEHGMVDLWLVPTVGGEATRLTSFDRDTYSPSIAADGSVVIKVQNYRTSVAVVGADGGPGRALTAFQSETPSWDPSGRWIGITYGTWRRVPDDAHYPDIAQDAGLVPADAGEPATAPASVVHDSVSEDQSLCWSPNGKWIVFHSHKEQSDDLWLRRADGGGTDARRITHLGRGAESGWPRWSADGRRVLFTGASRRTHQSAIYIVGIDQKTGEITEPEREVAIDASMDVQHAEWRGAANEIVAVVKEAPGRHAILVVSSAGGKPDIVHRFASEHDNPGLGVSPDGQHVAFIAPAADGHFQLFRMPIGGGTPVQLTTDPSNKTQPSWSPDGRRIAFTVWEYQVRFYRLTVS